MSRNFSNSKELKDELKRGNHLALVYLMRIYQHTLCSYAYSLSNDLDKSKDVVQNVFLKLWMDRDMVLSIKSLKNYLYRAVHNGIIDQWRKEKRMTPIEEKHFEVIEQITDDQEQLNKQLKFVELEIQNLPRKCREIFLLSKKDGLTNIEIANFLNISIRTVEGHINKAFKILREKLKENEQIVS